MTDAALLLLGLTVLLAGARWFVGGISAIAAAAGVSPLVIGMTVVAFGTSTPELVVNSVSAMKGSTGLAFGNIVGSCIVNIGFVLGLTAIIRPLRVEPSLITREIPMLIVAVAAVLILGSDRLLDSAARDEWRRADGLVLLLLFSIFLYYTTRQAFSSQVAGGQDAFIGEVKAEVSRQSPQRPLWQEAGFTLLGLAGVTVGAQRTVDSAVAMARGWGISEAVIGLTVISLGTTLPELATCVMAARRGDADIALGNVVGSNLFNLLCIGGLVSVIRPVPVPAAGGALDLAAMALLSIVLLPIAIRSGRTITRGEGALLLVLYAAYMTWRLTEALSS